MKPVQWLVNAVYDGRFVEEQIDKDGDSDSDDSKMNCKFIELM